MPPSLFQQLKSTQRLPTAPRVALRILQLVESDDSSLEEITQVISSDPALVAKLMRYISAPVFGLGLSGTTLPEAVARIGSRGVQMLALSFSLVSQQQRASCPSFNFDHHWSRALARAVAAQQLAEHDRRWDPHDAFISGLVAHIGELVLATAVPEEYEQLLSPAADEYLLLRHEHETFGVDRYTLGMALLKDWQLPEAIWSHVGALSPQGQPSIEPPLAILRLADEIALFLSDNDRQNSSAVAALTDCAASALEIVPEDFRTLLGRIGESWMAYGRLLAVPTGDAPDLAAIERAAEEQRTALRLAAEMEINSLRAENEQLSRIARRDRLTGLSNRRAFDEALPPLLTEAKAQNRPLALLLADIDHFKQVNDTHGHPIGDACLRHIACVLNDHLKEQQRVFRIGGEEFAVLVQDLTPDEAIALAERLRNAVATLPCIEAGRAIPLTISLGVAFAPSPDSGMDPAELVELADRRLYDAKRQGRNGVNAGTASAARTDAVPTVAPRSRFLRKLGRLVPAGRR